MPKVVAAVSDEDIRRSYYESATNPGMWITELELDPLNLVVCDNASGKYFRVPIAMQGDGFVFGAPAEVAVRYVEASAAEPVSAIVWASEEESRDGIVLTLTTDEQGTGDEQADSGDDNSGDDDASSGEIDYEALAAMAEPGDDADRERGIEALRSGEPVTASQAAAMIHAAAQRAKARTIQTPAAARADGPTHTEGTSSMPFDPKKIREALGLGPDATDEAVQLAWTSAYTPTPPPAPPAPETQDKDMSRLSQMAKSMGVQLIDPYQLAAMQQMAEQGQKAFNKQRRDERDQVIKAALEDGKIEVSSVERWQKKWDADPEGARETLNALAPNMVPMSAAGYAGTVAANEADTRLFDLYPEMKSQGGRR